MSLDLSKVVGYTTIGPPEALSMSKVLGYAVVSTESCINLSKVLAYAVVEEVIQTTAYPVLISVT